MQLTKYTMHKIVLICKRNRISEKYLKLYFYDNIYLYMYQQV